MKNLICIMIFFLSFNTFASEDWEGGQTGNGTNGCWYKNKNGNNNWKTIEEIKYWHLISPNHDIYSRYAVRNPGQSILRLRQRAPGIKYSVNLLRTKFSEGAIRRLKSLEANYPNVIQSILAQSHLLEDVTVVQYDIIGIFEGDMTNFFFRCERFSPAMITEYNGEVTVFRPVWNAIGPLTAEVIIVHELIRFTQMFDPNFYDLDNDDLQRLTAMLFSYQNENATFEKILKRFESRLSY